MQSLKDSESTGSRMTVQINEQVLLKIIHVIFPCTSVYALHLLQKTLSCDNYDAPPDHKPEACSTTGPYSEPIRLNIICTQIRLLIGTERTCEAFTKYLSALAWEDGQHTHTHTWNMFFCCWGGTGASDTVTTAWSEGCCIVQRENLWWVQYNQKQLFPCKNPSQ